MNSTVEKTLFKKIKKERTPQGTDVARKGQEGRKVIGCKDSGEQNLPDHREQLGSHGQFTGRKPAKLHS